MPIELPLPLKQGMESGECVLFCGAGIGFNARSDAGSIAPDGRMLAARVAERFGISAGTNASLSQVAQVAVLRKGRAELDAFLTATLAALEPDESLCWLFGLRWRAIFTTNYDRIIQRAFERNPNPQQRPVTISSSGQLAYYNPRYEVPIFHIHGCLFDPQSAPVLITEDDYALFREKRRMMFELVKAEFAKSTVLYLGYSNEDPNWRTVLEELRSEFQGRELPQSFRVSPSTDPLDTEILASKGITTIVATTDEFVSAARQAVNPVAIDHAAIERLRGMVPSDLHQLYATSAAAVSRLMSSWEYVNQARFDAPPNTQQFLAGDLPNWAVVGNQIPFKRDIEDAIFEHLLDCVTDPRSSQSVIMLLSPAGYGNSTLLMSIAARLVRERVGPVFFHRRGTPLIEGDMQFAARAFSERAFLFVDNAADHAATLEAALRRLRESHCSVVLVVGERLNEWRQANASLRGTWFTCDKLSDDEIERLLEYLRARRALGKLIDLSHQLQVAAIRNVHEKELLVAMREVTEGASFDAIIEDEYQNVAGDTARLFYAAVCCTSQSRVYLRDQLAAAVLGVDFAELYKSIGASLDGVVTWDCLDDTRSIYGARARHQVIARVVWGRCLADGEKEKILLEIMRSINLNYHADVRVFDALIRSDENIDGIGSFEAKTSFFETAARKDPESPYVLQHYARMLLREGRLELALSQIQRAKAIGVPVRILSHTEGLIYSRLAHGAESREIGRRHLVNAERAFESAMDHKRRDAYAFQGLADLYFDWARGCADEGESTLYIRKAEEIISRGLMTVRERESLWVASAKISQWLGDHPAALAALERAVAEEPTSVIARFLLARIYRRRGELVRAREALAPALVHNPLDHRCGVEFAALGHLLGESHQECIAVLRLSEQSGRRDPRYIALRGGLHFLNGDFTEAQRLFDDASTARLSLSERERIEFEPRDPADLGRPLRLVGTVGSIRSGYAFIRVVAYPDVFCPGSKFGTLRVQEGMSVQFELGFSARGPVALHIAESN